MSSKQCINNKTSCFLVLPCLNSSHAKKRFSKLIISSNKLWLKTLSLLTPPPHEFFDVPLVHKLSEFYLLFHQYLKLFPKAEKYTLGQKIESLILEILENSFRVAYGAKAEKTPLLQVMSIKINLLKTLIRLAFQIKALDNKKYIQLQEHLQEIGKMVGGWLRYLQKQ